MPKSIQRSFSGGEISPHVYSLTGIKKRVQGLARAKNVIVKKFGSIENRPGTELVSGFSVGKNSRITTFTDSLGESFILSWEDRTLSIIKESELGIAISRVITSPYPIEIVKHLKFSQSNDILVITTNYAPPRILKKTGPREFVFENFGLVRRNFLNYFSVTYSPAATDPGSSNTRFKFAISAILKDNTETTLYVRDTSVGRWVVRSDTGFHFGITYTALGNSEIKEVRVYIDSYDEYYLLAKFRNKVSGYLYIGEPHDATQVYAQGRFPFDFDEAGVLYTKSDDKFYTTAVDSPLENVPYYLAKSYFAVGRSPPEFPNPALDNRVVILRNGIPDSENPNQRIVEVYNYLTGEKLEKSPQAGIPQYDLYSLNNYPAVSSFYGQRLLVGSTVSRSEDCWVSKLGQYNDFLEPFRILPNSTYNFSVASGAFSKLKAIGGVREPILFTDSNEWSLGKDLSPTGITPGRESSYGIGDADPINAENSVIFTERDNILRNFGYDFNTGGYKGDDLTIFSSHLFVGKKIVSMAFQKDPDPIVWVCQDDGSVLSLTYFREQNIFAWTQHDLGGKCRQVVTTRRNNIDTVYFLIERGEVTLVEKLSNIDRKDNRTFKFCDSSVSIDGRRELGLDLGFSHRGKDDGSGYPWDETDLKLNVKLRGAAASVAHNADNQDEKLYNVGDEFHLYLDDGSVLRAIITGPGVLTRSRKGPDYDKETFNVRVDRPIPKKYQSDYHSNWGHARHALGGLSHLEGKEVSVYADGSVVASPYEDQYEKVVVKDGKISFNKNYVVITAGLPFVSDIFTLPIELRDKDTIIDYNMNVTKMAFTVQNTRGLYVGGRPPTEETSREGLRPPKTDYSDEVEIRPENGIVSKIVQGSWSKTAEVVVRQLGPLPMEILSLVSMGDIAKE